MGSFSFFLITYVLGGLTFIPLLLGLILLHAHLTFPYRPSAVEVSDAINDPDDDGKAIKSDAAALDAKFQPGNAPDVAEGYFAVCRDYVPGGVNGKPPARTTPAGEVVAEESPSVYQSMYRSIFDRKQAPSLESNKTNTKPTKKARNVFYVVLRHGHLMLYDDSEQTEVRHVISLAHHVVSIHGGGDQIPEGELWIKRNAICLKRKVMAGDIGGPSKPFYFFSENCSDKEDFYFALLQNQERNPEDDYCPPRPQRYEVKDIVSLVQRLHSSEENLETSWINAIVGRLFLAVYKTQQIEDAVRMKITKKIARVKKPAFLSKIVLQKIDVGEAAPMITNPHLKDLTVDGDCCVEADFKYEGNFRIEIAAMARIDLGTRFKTRDINLVLAAVIKKLEGHLLIRFKPPPCNRIWYSFETMPNLEMTIEPIVSSRQITYGIILRAIESRIREVLAETVVLPHWDDSPFLDTLHQRFRGGIWDPDDREPLRKSQHTYVPEEDTEQDIEGGSLHSSDQLEHNAQLDERSMSTPASIEGLSAAAESNDHGLGGVSEPSDQAYSSGSQRRPDVPKAIRSRSFASAADPIVSMDNANIDSPNQERKAKTLKDATSAMTELSYRSQSTISAESYKVAPNSRPGSFSKYDKSGSISSISSKESILHDSNTSQSATISSSELPSPDSPINSSFRQQSSNGASGTQRSVPNHSAARALSSLDNKIQSFPAIGAAAAAAKKWGLNAISRNASQDKTKTSSASLNQANTTPSAPIGRGRPLPPPGQPLPRPHKNSSTSILVPKRKPVHTPANLEHRQDDLKPRQEPAPALPARPDRRSVSQLDTSQNSPVLVVEAPPDAGSGSVSPLDDGFGDYLDSVQTEEDETHVNDREDGSLDKEDSREAG